LTASQVLRHLATAQEFRAENALLDKCEVEIGKWYVRGAWNDLDAWISYMSLAEIPNVDGDERVITSQARGRSGDEIPFRAIRSSGLLLSGTIKVRGYKPASFTRTPLANRPIEITARVSLNPTRFIRNQSPLSRTLQINQDGEYASVSFSEPTNIFRRSNAQQSAEGTEFALDDEADNFLPATRNCYLHASSRNWERNLQRYWDRIFEVIDRLVRTGEAQLVAPIEFLPAFKILKGEAYWEVYQQQAATKVASSQQRILASFPRGEVRNYQFSASPNSAFATVATNSPTQVENCEAALVYNSPCVRVHFSDNRMLRVYAKTNQRIRIEVVHDLTKNPPRFGARTSTSNSCLVEWARRLSTQSVHPATDVLQLLRGTSSSERALTALQLLTDIAECADELFLFADLLDILLSTSRIVRAKEDVRETAINKMVRHGILARQGRRLPVAYCITDNYQNALNELRRVLSPGVVPLRERG
jgi:hypothetical protein